MTPDALDITVAIILLLSAAIAWFRGLIREVFTLVALVAATGAAWLGGALMIPPFSKWLGADADVAEYAAKAVSRGTADVAEVAIAKQHLIGGVATPEVVAKLCAYSSVFLFIYLVMSLVGYVLSKSVTESGLGIVDKLLGAGFGLARGFILVFLFFLPVSFLIDHEKLPDWAKNSVSVPVLEQSVAFVDTHFGLRQMIEDRGGEIALKIGRKIDPEDLDGALRPDEEQLHEELTEEEKRAAR
jgi:membrane protein required for colicin V production